MYIYIYTIDEFDISILISYQLIVSIDFFRHHELCVHTHIYIYLYKCRAHAHNPSIHPSIHPSEVALSYGTTCLAGVSSACGASGEWTQPGWNKLPPPGSRWVWGVGEDIFFRYRLPKKLTYPVKIGWAQKVNFIFIHLQTINFQGPMFVSGRVFLMFDDLMDAGLCFSQFCFFISECVSQNVQETFFWRFDTSSLKLT